MKKSLSIIKVGQVSKQTLGLYVGLVWEVGRPNRFVLPLPTPSNPPKKD